ncbi:ABC transporter ATP-binding protein [Dehalogenimonas sp. WBC-2]|nr:ABC transporter ATP-binding protein [Dehalogenimonas sp. WBC-2]
MAYINTQDISLSFGGAKLFESINLTIERGEKVALVGRNGSGKSTLLKVIAGLIRSDSGTIAIQKGIRLAYLGQTVPDDIPGSVFDIIKAGEARISDSLEIDMERQKIGRLISQFGLEGDRTFNDLSAGLKRQVLLAGAFFGEPDVLLLDEPTNHMDIDSIKRLEDILLKHQGSVVFVTHDRSFLRRIATRIVEIDRGNLFDQSCDYQTFLERRAAAREIEGIGNALFDKKLESEEAWIRTGVRARGTRNEGRVRALEKMRATRRARKQPMGIIRLEGQKAERSGTLVVEAKNVTFNYDDTPVITDFSTTIMKGDRVGILGPNGSGKTTLLRLLLSELQPTSGTIKLGTNLQISYSDQLRAQLDNNKTIMENVSQGNDTVTIDGKTRNIFGYLQDFEFSRDQAMAYVSHLSGGERNRLVLARLFTRPSNLLVLDEPTNDLDLETLEILEDYLLHYTGTILMVSHDRAFINNVVTSTLVFEKNGSVKEYVGGYDDWLRQYRPEIELVKPSAGKPATLRNKSPDIKFGFRQKKELESIPHSIQALETECDELYSEMSDSAIYKRSKSELAKMKERVETIKGLLVAMYARWEELEQQNNEPQS